MFQVRTELIVGLCVMGAVVPVIMTIATFMGIRAFKKSRKAARMRRQMKSAAEQQEKQSSDL